MLLFCHLPVVNHRSSQYPRALGAVGLTLALIFVEDDRVEDSIRSLVLFYVAGIAAMTLVINGSLAGYLVSYLGLDRRVTKRSFFFLCSRV